MDGHDGWEGSLTKGAGQGLTNGKSAMASRLAFWCNNAEGSVGGNFGECSIN
jgi:hypothetical protein